MSKFSRKEVVSNRGATSDITRDRFRARFQCYSNNPDVLRALVAHQLPDKTDLAVRVHVWNCDHCRSEYLRLKAESVVEVASPELKPTSELPVVEESNEFTLRSGEDADFCELLKEILSGQQSRDAILIDRVFQRRLKLICQNATRNAADADDLANHVRAVVCDKLDQFEPKYELPYGNFFGWVKRIARNKFIDDLRRRAPHHEYSQLDESFLVEDVTVDIEAEAERREAVERFWAFVSNLNESTQKVMQYHLKDNSLREIEDKLAEDGTRLSHVAIGHLVKKVVADFLANEDTRIAALIARKGKYLSRDHERGGPSARKTGS